jgi:Ni/Fe-hydrogenase subunit HybB-like protein
MVILESHLSGRAFGRKLELDLLEPLGRAMVFVLGIYGLLRLLVMRRSGAFAAFELGDYESSMFLLEITLGVALPVLLLSFKSIRYSERGLVIGAFLAVLGFVVNRLNVSLTGMEAAAGVAYLPSFMEVIVSVGLVAVGFAAFAVAARHLPIFPEAPGEAQRLRAAV